VERGEGVRIEPEHLRSPGVRNLSGNVVDETGTFDAPRIHFGIEAIIGGWNSLGIEVVTAIFHGVDVVLDAL